MSMQQPDTPGVPRSASFRLPVGFRAADGTVHQDGELRLPTQHDKVRVYQLAGDVANPAYLETLLLMRIIVRLGPMEFAKMAPGDVEDIVQALTLKDIDHMNAVWEHLDRGAQHPEMATCPRCKLEFRADDLHAIPEGGTTS